MSAWVKPRPDPGVIAWLADVDEDRVFLSVVTQAELRHGIDRLRDGRRRKRLDTQLTNELLPRFEGRLLQIDQIIADRWDELVARREADFKSTVDEIVNPWTRPGLS